MNQIPPPIVVAAPPPAAELINKETLAERLGVSIRTIEGWVARRRIPFVRLPGGRLIRFRWSDVMRALDARVVASVEGK